MCKQVFLRYGIFIFWFTEVQERAVTCISINKTDHCVSHKNTQKNNNINNNLIG